MARTSAPMDLCVALALAAATALPACRQKPGSRPKKRAASADSLRNGTSSETRPTPAKVVPAPGARSRDPAIEKAISDGEAAAIEALRHYLAAQTEFRTADRYGKGEAVYANPRDGKGFVDLSGLPSGKELGLVDAAMARAASAAGAKNGYYFVDITSDAAGREYDPAIDHGLSAVPAEYGITGRCTFVIDVTGTILKKDNGGRPVATHPGVGAEGWEITGMLGGPRAERRRQNGGGRVAGPLGPSRGQRAAFDFVPVRCSLLPPALEKLRAPFRAASGEGGTRLSRRASFDETGEIYERHE